MGEVVTRLTYNILSDALFSGDLSEDAGEMVRLVGVILDSLGKPDPLDILGMPSYVPRMTKFCLLYTSPSPRDATLSRMPSSA